MSRIKGALYVFGAFVVAANLTGCGESDEVRLVSMLETKQTQQAIELATKHLDKDASTPIYNAVMAQLLTETCVPERCPPNKPRKTRHHS